MDEILMLLAHYLTMKERSYALVGLSIIMRMSRAPLTMMSAPVHVFKWRHRLYPTPWLYISFINDMKSATLTPYAVLLIFKSLETSDKVDTHRYIPFYT